MSDNTLAMEDTGSSTNNNQAEEKFYTQKEVDDLMARTKGAVTKKISSKYEDLGDPDELRQIKQQFERQKLEEQKKRGEFDTILQDLAKKKDEEIRKRDEIIKNYTVDVPLVSAAAQYRAVNAEQVKQLLKPQVRLNDVGDVEVLDTKGTVRYNDQGQPFRVEDLVKEFLDTNPHFVSAGASTSNGKSNIGQSQEKIDLTKLDMKNPEHRRMFKELGGVGLRK
jgi:hypothetical protein